VKAGFEHAQANPLLGIRLPVLFGQAGIAEVGALGLQAYWPPESRIGPAYAVGVVRALKSAIVASGIATEEELGLDTLEQRLVEAIVSANAVCTPATVVGAWGRRPRLAPHVQISVPYLLQCSMDEFASRSARTIGCGSAYPRAPFPRLISGPA